MVFSWARLSVMLVLVHTMIILKSGRCSWLTSSKSNIIFLNCWKQPGWNFVILTYCWFKNMVLKRIICITNGHNMICVLCCMLLLGIHVIPSACLNNTVFDTASCNNKPTTVLCGCSPCFTLFHVTSLTLYIFQLPQVDMFRCISIRLYGFMLWVS